jgi:hypothetical protein
VCAAEQALVRILSKFDHRQKVTLARLEAEMDRAHQREQVLHV